MGHTYRCVFPLIWKELSQKHLSVVYEREFPNLRVLSVNGVSAAFVFLRVSGCPTRSYPYIRRMTGLTVPKGTNNIMWKNTRTLLFSTPSRNRKASSSRPPDQDESCIVCYSSARERVLYICAHRYVCAECDIKLDACPVCRTPKI